MLDSWVFLFILFGSVVMWRVLHEKDKPTLGVLRVLVVQDGQHIFCQCLEIDYTAQGRNVAEATHNFQEGLLRTVEANLEKNKNTYRMVLPAPKEIWREAFDGVGNGTIRCQPGSLPKRVRECLHFQSVVYLVSVRPYDNRSFSTGWGST